MLYTSTNTNSQFTPRMALCGGYPFYFPGFVYGFFHHHQDFSSHPDRPACTLAGQAPVTTPPAGGLSPDQTPQPFFPSTITLPVDPSFPTQTYPRAPPA